MTKNNEDEDGDLDNKKRKEIKDFAIWFNRTEKQNQEKRKKDLKRKRELEQVCTETTFWTKLDQNHKNHNFKNAPGGSRMKNGLGKSDMQLTRQLLSNPEPSYSPSVSPSRIFSSVQIIKLSRSQRLIWYNLKGHDNWVQRHW